MQLERRVGTSDLRDKTLMIEFHCKNCGQRFNVPKTRAGKMAKCPKCNSRVSTPEAQATAVTDQGIRGDMEPVSKAVLYDLTLLDVSQQIKIQSQPGEQPVPDETPYEQLRRLQGTRITHESDQIPQRRLPWMIDIFLYPIAKPGLIMLGLIIAVSLLLKTLRRTIPWAAFAFPPLIIVAVPVVIVACLIAAILWLYFCWYFCECVRDSAAGQLRAPETIDKIPGLSDMLWQLLRTVVCLAVFLGPVLIRFRHNRMTDMVFWALLGYGMFLFPIGLLAVVMFDSLRGLNPVLLIGSIFSAFFQYCALALFIGIGVFILLSLPITKEALILRFILRCVCIYLALVTAHLLGRFYWRYQEKLNWEV